MRPRFLAAAVAVLAVAALAVVLAARTSRGAPDPFVYVYGTGVGPWNTRPGWQNGYLYGDAINRSHATLTINSVSLAGRGVGSVVTVSVMIAPLVAGTHATPGSNYATNPPVYLAATCHKQALYPVKGYRMKPGAQFRLWIIVTAVRPGRWNIPHQVVNYTEDGSAYTHSFPISYWGTVKRRARVSALIIPGDNQAQCVRPEGARYLHYYHG